MLTAIVGVNWGDEGKGRMVDLFSERYGVVVRYQGGNNAGHTVVNDRGKFILNLMPSGILRAGTVNVLGPGMVIDLEHLCAEAERLRQGGIQITPETLKISGKATICMPYHKLLDCLEEDRLAGKKFGSTRRGIAPCPPLQPRPETRWCRRCSPARARRTAAAGASRRSTPTNI